MSGCFFSLAPISLAGLGVCWVVALWRRESAKERQEPGVHLRSFRWGKASAHRQKLAGGGGGATGKGGRRGEKATEWGWMGWMGRGAGRWMGRGEGMGAGGAGGGTTGRGLTERATGGGKGRGKGGRGSGSGRGGGDRETGWEVRAVAAGAGAGCEERGGRCSTKLEPALFKMLIVCKHKFRVFVLCSLAF